jgi:toxin-antitoxin system PIN domain toxin
MIAVDTNILVYAHRADSPWHDRARSCVRGLAEGKLPWVIPWPCIHEFLAIVTHPRIYKTPTPVERAIEQIACWLESPSLVVQSESTLHWARLTEIVRRGVVVGPAIHDARVAAICLDSAVSVLYSADRDFQRFPALRVINPLVA